MLWGFVLYIWWNLKYALSLFYFSNCVLFQTISSIWIYQYFPLWCKLKSSKLGFTFIPLGLNLNQSFAFAYFQNSNIFIISKMEIFGSLQNANILLFSQNTILTFSKRKYIWLFPKHTYLIISKTFDYFPNTIGQQCSYCILWPFFSHFQPK